MELMVEQWPILTLFTVAYVLLVVVVGVWSRKGHTMSKIAEWGVGGRGMSIFFIFFLQASAWISAYTFLGSPGWAYTRGLPVMYVVTYLTLMAIHTYYVGPFAWKLSNDHGIMTMPEAARVRFESESVGMIFSIVTSLGLIAYGVLQATGSAYILYVVTGGRIPHALGVLLILGFMSIYIYTSGIRAIGFTNMIQGILMLIVSWSAGIWAMRYYFGSSWFGEVFRLVAAESPEHLTVAGALGDWNYAFWTTSIIVSMISIWPSTWIFWASARSGRTIRRMAAILPLYMFVLLPTIAIGFAGIFHFPDIAVADHIALYMVVPAAPIILGGLYAAATLAGAMSSSEPMIHTVAMTITRDILGPIFKWTDEQQGKIVRPLIFPVMLILIAPLAIAQPAQLVYILIIGYGFIAQGFAAVIGLMIWPRATKTGIIVGLIVGGIITALFSFIWAHPLGIHAGIWGIMGNLVLMVIISLNTAPASRDTIEKFFPEEVVKEAYGEESVPREPSIT